MTVADYIRGKFQTFGINLSESDLLEMALSSGLNTEDEMSRNNIGIISVSMARFIPSLLLRPSSINESGFSISWNIDGVKQYYAYLCNMYGLENVLDIDKPKVRFL